MCFGQQQEVPYTLEDRDRLIKVEERMKSLEKNIEILRKEIDVRFEAQNGKFESQDDRLNNIQTLLYFVLGGMFGLIGFILWDRRTFIKPFNDKVKDVEDKNTRIINTLKEQAKNNPSLAEILKNTGIY